MNDCKRDDDTDVEFRFVPSRPHVDFRDWRIYPCLAVLFTIAALLFEAATNNNSDALLAVVVLFGLVFLFNVSDTESEDAQ